MAPAHTAWAPPLRMTKGRQTSLLRRDGAGQDVDDGGLAGGHLVVDPLVGLLHAVLETDGGRPTHQLLDQVVVAVAPAHALGRIELVGALEPDAGDLLDDVDQAVDADPRVAADVQGLDDVAVGQPDRAVGAVVALHERAGLLAVAPELALALA